MHGGARFPDDLKIRSYRVAPNAAAQSLQPIGDSMVGVVKQMIGCRITGDGDLVPRAHRNGTCVGPPTALQCVSKIFGEGALDQEACRAAASGGPHEFGLDQRVGKLAPRQRTLSKSRDGSKRGKTTLLLESIEVPFPKPILEKGDRSVWQREPGVPPILRKVDRNRVDNSSRRHNLPGATRQA
jgi:hypothetical protein